MPPRFHELTVKDVRRETSDAVSVGFAVPADLEEDFRYAPGQYVTLKAEIGGEDVRRSYSICSGLDDGELRVAIKRVDGGLFSSFANSALAPGDRLDVMTPSGRFVLPPAEGGRVYAAFAAGSGITPILAHVKTILRREPESVVHLFYGNQSSQTILFRDQLEDLKDRFVSRLSVYHVLSRETQDVSLLNGRIDREKVATFMQHVVPVATVDRFLICGPGDMIDGTRETLLSMGAPEAAIHTELFRRVTPRETGEGARVSPVAHSDGVPAPGRPVRITLDGVTQGIELRADETIIDGCIRAGIDAPYSCRGGMCCTCRTKLVSGEVEMKLNYSLESWELEAGFVLACQSIPLTDDVHVDFDTA